MFTPWTGRHLHDFMTDRQLTETYKHCTKPCTSEDARCNKGTWSEMRWRTCDAAAPPLGTDGWYTQYRPAEGFLTHTRISLKDVRRLDPSLTSFTTLEMQPAMFSKHVWSGNGEKDNAFKGKSAGGITYGFSDEEEEVDPIFRFERSELGFSDEEEEVDPILSVRAKRTLSQLQTTT
jgi:hypothetical protein